MQSQTYLEYLKIYKMRAIDIVSTDKLIFSVKTILKQKETISAKMKIYSEKILNLMIAAASTNTITLK